MPYADIGPVSLSYQDTGPVSSADGPPLLLLHELGGSSESWAGVIPLLSSRRRVVAMDCRCAGGSEKPTSFFAFDALADDAAALLRHLDIATADIAGAAMGSLIGILLAGRHPGLVRRLAMFAVAPDMSGPTADYLTARAGRVRQDGMRAVMDASLRNAFPDGFEAERAAYRPIYLGNDPAAYASLSLALAQTSFGPDIWAAVRCPALVVSGARDFIWPPELGRETAARIAGACFEILRDAGHFPHMQTQAALAEAAGRFFSGPGVL